jgi:hypothetical protein
MQAVTELPAVTPLWPAGVKRLDPNLIDRHGGDDYLPLRDSNSETRIEELIAGYAAQ